MRLIILAAGQGYKLGNFNKILLKNPQTGQSVLDLYKKEFSSVDITIVVGYNAVNIINEYPEFKYIYNADWHLTRDSYSLGLALSEEPCYVIHSDFFITKSIKEKLNSIESNCAVTLSRDSRTSSSINCIIKDRKITKVYQGDLLSPNDPELIGIYKFTQTTFLRDLKRNCLDNKNLFLGQNLPISKNNEIFEVSGNDLGISIIKTPLDYINYVKENNPL